MMGDHSNAGIVRGAARSSPETNPSHATQPQNSISIRLVHTPSHPVATKDYDEAILSARKNVETISDGHPDQAQRFGELGVQLELRFLSKGDVADLNEAISFADKAVNATKKNHEAWPRRMCNLAALYGHRYSRAGEDADLDEAIRMTRESLDATPDNQPDRPVILNNLASLLLHRYSRKGAMSALEEALDLSRKVLELTPEDHPSLAIRWSSLGTKLSFKYSRIAATADIDDAISASRKAVAAIPDGHPSWAECLNNLANQLAHRSFVLGKMADLEEGIGYAQKAIEVAEDACLDQAGYLCNLASLLGKKASRTRELTHLGEAIIASRKAVKITADDFRDRAAFMTRLGALLLERYSIIGSATDLKEAKMWLEMGLNHKNAGISIRINAGRQLLSAPNILEDQEAAYHRAKTLIDLVPLSAPHFAKPEDKQHHLSQVVGLASDAAAIALHTGQSPVSAIKLLETGRDVLASSLQDMRSDISTLKQQHPELAQTFFDLRNRLDTPASASTAVSAPHDPDHRHKASNGMDTLLQKIRSQPGFKGFLLPATEDEMRRAARFGAVVIINVSSHRCDALIIEQLGVRALELHQLSKEQVLTRAKELQSLETLGWLWDVIVSPVLDTLGLTKPLVGDGEAYPHMWWIPTGPLVHFPLHAAGYHTSPGFKTALDRVVSSYSSSIKTILHTRQQHYKPIAAESPQDVALVAMQCTPTLTPLKYANIEIDEVRAACDSIGLRHTQPKPPLQKDVLSALKACRIFHFAGHGKAHPLDPLQSQLLLEDWRDHPLTVVSLLETNLSSKLPFLAYLSACGTSQVLDERSVDESINLTSAFQLAGFRHTIGTLWEVDDRLCGDMAKMTYEFLGKGGVRGMNLSVAGSIMPQRCFGTIRWRKKMRDGTQD